MIVQGSRFGLDPSPDQAGLLASHCGAARKAFNEALARVRRCLDQRDAERSYGVPDEQLTEGPWTLPALRRWWNASKSVLAPWWAENSKEAYNSGLAALADGLKQWPASRSGKRRGRGGGRRSPGYAPPEAGRGRRPGYVRCRAARPARTAGTGVPGGAAGSGGSAPPRGSRGSTPARRTCAATRCTRPPPGSPAGTRSSPSKTSTSPAWPAANPAPDEAGGG